MNKNIALKQFNENYTILKESEKSNFSRIVNKLFQVNFITKRKVADANDYRFILAYKSVFEGFLWLCDFDLHIKREDEVLFITNENGYNHFNLRKTESILILVIRILYERKKDLITLDSDVEIYLYEIHEELKRIGFFEDKRMTKDRLKPILTFLKGYNIIDYLDRGLHDDARMKIYPTIIYVTDLESIKDVVDRLDEFISTGDDNEETYED